MILRAVDFGYVFSRVARFYGMSFTEVRDMPVRSFWLMNRMIERVRAEEMLDWMPVHSTAMGGKHVEGIARDLKNRMGEPVIQDRIKASKTDVQRAKALFGGGGL